MKPAPQKYRRTNWKAYNAALKARGSLLIWLDPTMNWQGRATGERGWSPCLSDEAIQFCLSLLYAKTRQGHPDADIDAAGDKWLSRTLRYGDFAYGNERV